MQPSSITFEAIEKRFSSSVAIAYLDLEVRAGELLVIVGPSGCGKSTALRLVAGLEEPTAGRIRIDGTVVNGVEPRQRDVAMVFQNYALYPHLSVRKNIEFPLRARGMPSDQRAQLVSTTADTLHLTELLDRRPGQLSGGQRQRVALARAMVRQPKAFLMDEPLSNLDARLRVGMRAELIELQRRTGATVLYVTHDQVEAMTMGHRIAIMSEGRLQQVGTPDEVHHYPANTFVGGFIGSPPMNMLHGRLDADTNAGQPHAVVAGGWLSVPSGYRSGPIIVGIRPEHLAIDPDGTITATVSLVEALGHEYHVVCQLPTSMGESPLLIVRLSGSSVPPRLGDALRLRSNGPVHLFDAEDGIRLPTPGEVPAAVGSVAGAKSTPGLLPDPGPSPSARSASPPSPRSEPPAVDVGA